MKVSVEVREGADRLEIEVYADSISQAVGITKERLPGCDVRVMFPIDGEVPIDGEEFFGGHRIEGSGTEASRQLGLLPDRIL